MTPTTEDLRTMFTQVSSTPPPLTDPSATAAQRGRTIRRRRVGAAAVVVAVAVGAFALPHLPGRTTSAPPAGPTPSPTVGDDSLTPEYFRGGRRTAIAAETNRQGVSLTYIPASTGFGVAASCFSPAVAQGAAATGDAGADEPMAEVLVDGQPVTGGNCQGQVVLSGAGDLSEPTDLGLTPGIPVTVTMRPAAGAAAQLGVTDWQLAIYEPVPLEEYPFPEPPDTLLQVESDTLNGEGRRVLWGDASDSDGFTYQFPVEHGLELVVQTTEPGELRLYVDDQLVITQRSWTYDLATEATAVALPELGIDSGDSVEVRVEADGFAPGTLQFALFDDRP